MKQKEIKALMVAPKEYPKVVTLKTDLDSLQKAVSIGASYQGLIEIIHLEKGVCLICNEEGKLNGLPGNRRLSNDIIAGVFYIVGEDKEGNLVSLREDKMALYEAYFHEPQDISQEEVATALFFRFI